MSSTASRIVSSTAASRSICITGSQQPIDTDRRPAASGADISAIRAPQIAAGGGLLEPRKRLHPAVFRHAAAGCTKRWPYGVPAEAALGLAVPARITSVHAA